MSIYWNEVLSLVDFDCLLICCPLMHFLLMYNSCHCPYIQYCFSVNKYLIKFVRLCCLLSFKIFEKAKKAFSSQHKSLLFKTWSATVDHSP